MTAQPTLREMISTDFLRYEKVLSAADFEKIGKLTLRWSLVDHTVGNCLRVLLRLTPAEAVSMVFSLGAAERRDRMRKLLAIKDVSEEAEFLFKELDAVMIALQPVRNGLVHSIMTWNSDGSGANFHNRSKLSDYAKGQIFETQDLTTYAVIVVENLRVALGPKDAGPDELPPPLPGRPSVPEFLRSKLHWPAKPIEKKRSSSATEL